jgi:hypothetical protein
MSEEIYIDGILAQDYGTPYSKSFYNKNYNLKIGETINMNEEEKQEEQSSEKTPSLTNQPFITINFPLDNTYLHLKNLMTNEGIFENVRYDGNLESFLKDLNKGRMVKLILLDDSNKVIYLNSIYIISFEV